MNNENCSTLHEIIKNIETVIIGKTEIIKLTLCAFLSQGHVLIEDMPGVGKTSLVCAIAKSFSCTFSRIQFTPDVLPTDVSGFTIYNQQKGVFEYKAGAINAQIVLADEINRTSPKTQSSLLEAMAEQQVTVDGKTYQLPKPFIVFATQNPVEFVGTFPLPEAQLDRFFMRLSLGYPSFDEEIRLLNRFKEEDPLDKIQAVTTVERLLKMQRSVQNVHVDASILTYIVALINKTRNHPDILLGASPRASLALLKASQSWAYINNRNYVVPEDVIKLIDPILSHRIVRSQEAKFKKRNPRDILNSIIQSTKIPT